MHKKRLIFTLLYCDGYFMLSRNFRLQRVGNLEWIENNYNFKNIAFAIDELIILNVSRKERNLDEFRSLITGLIRNIFVPIAVGGGVININYANSLFMSGADKIVINSALIENPALVEEIIKKYGSQSVVASIDYAVEDNNIKVYINNGFTLLKYSFPEYINYLHDLGVGEIYLNSIKKDGTGHGFDMDIFDKYLNLFKIPVIVAGGAGNSKHLIEAALHTDVDAVATANLFNFIGQALPNSRLEMLEKGIPLAKFQQIPSFLI